MRSKEATNLRPMRVKSGKMTLILDMDEVHVFIRGFTCTKGGGRMDIRMVEADSS